VAAEVELAAVRGELFESLAEQDRLAAERDGLQLTAAAALASGRPEVVDAAGVDALESARGVMLAVAETAAELESFCDLLAPALEKMPADQVETVKLKYRMEELRAKAGRLRVLSAAPEARGRLAQCRVLAVDAGLGVAVIGAGSAAGVRNGLVWRTADGKTAVRVIAVRPYISAAAPSRGDLADLLPGVALQTEAPEAGPGKPAAE
jgi:hypothetical protein